MPGHVLRVLQLGLGVLQTRVLSPNPGESARGTLALVDGYAPSLTGGFLGFEEVTGAVHFV